MCWLSGYKALELNVVSAAWRYILANGGIIDVPANWRERVVER